MTKLLSLPLLGLIFSVTGCGISPLSSRLSNPVLEDRVGLLDDSPVGIIATTAERRAIIFRDVDQSERAKKGFGVELCAEPPPDAAANIASQLSAQLDESKGNVKLLGLTASQKVELISHLLFARSQGIQMYRDGMYNLCVASLNKYITPAFYMKHSAVLLKASQELALKEVELRDLASRIPNSLAAPSPSSPAK